MKNYLFAVMVVDPIKVEVAATEGGELESKKAAKKKSKEAEKAAKRAEHKAASGKAPAEAHADNAEDYSKDHYGHPTMIRSENKFEDRVFANVWELSKHINAAPVWVRGRVHTSRSKGKQCFLILRQNSNTVQCVIAVNDEVSKQMVKFSGK